GRRLLLVRRLTITEHLRDEGSAAREETLDLRPEDSVLRRVLYEHLSTFLEDARARNADDCLPVLVERELRAFLSCGVLARGLPASAATSAGTRSPSRAGAWLLSLVLRLAHGGSRRALADRVLGPDRRAHRVRRALWAG